MVDRAPGASEQANPLPEDVVGTLLTAPWGSVWAGWCPASDELQVVCRWVSGESFAGARLEAIDGEAGGQGRARRDELKDRV